MIVRKVAQGVIHCAMVLPSQKVELSSTSCNTYLRDDHRFQPLEMKKWEISPRLNTIIANVWGADQVKNWEILENVTLITDVFP